MKRGSLGWFRFCFQPAKAASGDDDDDGDDDGEKKLPAVVIRGKSSGPRYQGMFGGKLLMRGQVEQ